MSTPIIAGEIYQLTDRVRRITAPNPGIMTGPGTNTYLLGRDQVAVVDPGPVIDQHVEAILNACGDRLSWIISTHTHRDHSPAAAVLAKATGATVLGNLLPENDGYQDESFQPASAFAHDETLTTDEFSLRAIYTPGHVDNHLCFLVEEDGLLLTGDHIMQGSTVVIIPPHGDMKAYIESLQLLLEYPLQSIAPGHGGLIDKPIEEVKGLVAHRLKREAKVMEKLQQASPIELAALVPLVYDDVDPKLHPIAEHSLLAHLLKLEKELRATSSDQCWRIL